MGEGKTSVITPMVVSKLADGKNLVRAIVLRPLLRQSINLLSHRLGGLMNRRIYHIPFDRKTEIGVSAVVGLAKIYTECKKEHGILISLPEHILSFRLVGMDLADKDRLAAEVVLKLERYLQNTCRDVIDESDEVLHTRFQLVYTMGNQEIIDGGVDRWGISQNVFRLVEKHAHTADPFGLEIESDEIAFPKIRFLHPDAMGKLADAVMGSIEKGELSGVPFNHWRPKVRESASSFIRCYKVSKGDADTVLEAFKDHICFNRLLILRGLFAHRVLAFALQSYYYQGLTSEQVQTCFSLLAKENDGASEYQNWISRGKKRLSVGLRDLTGVNLDDVQSFKCHLYPHLRYQKGIIDFYLSNVVFPREAKQFPMKLSTSAWDIPSRTKTRSTTGFSGTNDNRSMLPLSIEQKDLPNLAQTNAMVLMTLLKPENRSFVVAQDDTGRQLGTVPLLELVQSLTPRVQVLIDVGAQILELENCDVAKEWLAITPGAEAAIYFDDRDEAMVVDRHHHVESLIASPFNDRLDNCLVFLDQHHSRGVDLKLPVDSRAAVTLGPRLTKDKLVQACNRLRKLGGGQTVVFLSPPEVSSKIRELSGMLEDHQLNSSHVIRWTLAETCENMDSLRPLWALQGLDYCRRWEIWKELEASDYAGGVVYDMQECESRPLKEAYGVWQTHKPLATTLETVDGSDPIARKLQKAWESLDLDEAMGHLLHEEQEREVACEVERERQVERPAAAMGARHQLHPDLRHYATHGTFGEQNKSKAVELAFDSLKMTTAARYLPRRLSSNLFVTHDFANTVKNAGRDEFVKPVNWLLSSVHNNDLIIISQYEADRLLPIIELSRNTTLSAYAPRLTQTMASFRDLDFVAFEQQPPSARALAALPLRQLEFFAGNLYFDSFALYQEFCGFLGLVTDQTPDSKNVTVSDDGFVDRQGRSVLGWPVACPFTSSPLQLLNTLVAIQRRGQAFQRSHVACILDRKMLTEEDFAAN
ncbi:predicted protein [Uncinocarpus reesii 1704]|uniref:ubiquitinyl hydrolase 1 n=1 Tax=Uncinocarpus reesii (strain UAMH 1704) TaxID=336963 RepID=C4JQK7_UNCRE|nr:uncharacterized protein UREG_03352 [Uncinocarpus reesii 1704]EEP78506.1 predicted protein [Uncinocarpus reesii 1704]